MSAVTPTDPASPATPLTVVFQQINQHESRGELDQAEALLRDTFGAEPLHPHAIHLSGILAWRRGRLDQARELMDRSIELVPGNGLYYRNLCELCRITGRYEQGLMAGQRAASLMRNDVATYVNLSMLHYDRGDPDGALQCAETALALDPASPDAHFARGKALLLSGRLREGWEEYEWRFKIPNGRKMLPKLNQPQWDGQPLSGGRLLLIADQGYGDVIQFSRYIPWAAERCDDIVVAAAPELHSLLRQLPGVRSVCARWEDVGEFAYYCPLSGLPRLHGTQLDTVPSSVPYLRADPTRVSHWREQLARLLPEGYRRIAIAWAGRPAHPENHWRSVGLDCFQPLARLERTNLIALQKGRGVEAIGSYLGWAPLLNLGPNLRDFDDTMAVLECVDLLVSVDTAVGHLAGALGRPAWLALAHVPDWRWLSGREDTPWYPQHRLFRQAKRGDWSPVFAGIAKDIEIALPG